MSTQWNTNKKLKKKKQLRNHATAWTELRKYYSQ